MPYRNLSLLACMLLVGLLGCTDDRVCISASAECDPLYEPTFDNVFLMTLQPKCGVAGVACHARDGAHGGLVFADVDEAFAQLKGSGSLLDSELPGCGELLARLRSDDVDYQMPRGAPLPEAEVCAITQWVLMGAQR